MGLSFQDSDAQWAYGGFMAFRQRVWTACGFPGDLYDVYSGKGEVKLEIAKDHPIYDFINHSDCEGELTPKQLEVILPSLEKVLTKLKSENLAWDHDVLALGDLIITCEDCIHNGKPLVFC